MSKAKATILVDLNEKPAVEGIKNLTKQFTTGMADINASVELAGKAFSLVTGAIGAITGAVVNYTKAAIEVEHIERRTVAAMRLRSDVTDSLLSSLKDFNNAQQQALGIDADSLLQLQGSLAARGVHNDKLKEATKETIGLAEVTGQDLAAAGVAVAKVHDGNIKALSRLGIHATSAADAHKKLAEFYTLASAQSGTLETQVKRLGANYGDLEETLGAMVTKSSGLRDVMGALNELMVTFVNIFSGDEGARILDGFFRVLAGGLASTLNALLGAYQLLKDIQNINIKESLFGGIGHSAKGIVNDVKGFLGFEGDQPPLVSPGAGPPRSAIGFGAGAGAQDSPFKVAIQSLADSLTKISTGGIKLLTGIKITGKRTGASGGAGDPEFSASFDDLDMDYRSKKGGGQRDKFQPYLDLGRGMLKGLNQTDMQARVAEPFEKYREELRKQQEITDLQIQTDTANSSNNWIEMFSGMGSVIVGGLGSIISGMTQEIVSGHTDMIAALGKLFGGFMVQMGNFLIQMGTAALLGGILGTAAPFLGLVTGGPNAIAAGGLAIAGGIGLVAAGSAIGGSGGGGRGANSGIASHGNGRASRDGVGGFHAPLSSAPNGFTPNSSTNGNEPRNITINFNRPVGDPRRAAREVEDMLRGGN